MIGKVQDHFITSIGISFMHMDAILRQCFREIQIEIEILVIKLCFPNVSFSVIFFKFSPSCT